MNMESQKRYYWLKLNENFMEQPVIRYLRNLPDGSTTVLIYIKLLLISLQSSGYIYTDALYPTMEEDLALRINEKVESIQYALLALEKAKLIIRGTSDQWDLQMTDLPEMVGVGSETASAKRSRAYRKRKTEMIETKVVPDSHLLQCNSNETGLQQERHAEIEQDKETEPENKSVYGTYQNVFLTDEEYTSLQQSYPYDWLKKINRLSQYLHTSGRKYDSHYETICAWAKEDSQKQKPGFQDYSFKKGESY